MQHPSLHPKLRRAALASAAAICLALSACGSNKPKPAQLGPNVAKIAVNQAWTAQIGAVQYPLQIHVAGDQLWLASSRGDVVALDGASGRELARLSLDARLAAGVGSDGKRAAVVTNEAQLIVIENGQEIWRRKLASQTYTTPLVAGERVFVLGGDRSVHAYDGATGQPLWDQQPRQQDPLVLRQSALLMAVGNTLLVGQGGRLTAIEPSDGHLLWEAPVATPRGTNDVEKLADLIAPAARDQALICVRAFQTSVGCVDANSGQILWTKHANGATGLAMDDSLVFGAEADDTIRAWSRNAGENKWSSQHLRYRNLSAPLVISNALVFGDDKGLIHMLSREDGSPLNRLSTDGSRIAAPPVQVAGRLVVVTQKGGVFAFQPQ